jgi:hypothetical protein
VGLIALCILLALALVSVIVLPVVGVPLPWLPEPVQPGAPSTTTPQRSAISPANTPTPAETHPAPETVQPTHPDRDETPSSQPSPPVPPPSPDTQPPGENHGGLANAPSQPFDPLFSRFQDSESVLVRVLAELNREPQILNLSGSVLNAERTYAASRVDQLRVVRYLP